ncbi:CBS domain protein [hydrothermal vent metagenome]|uniref:CBS domain protein n=1 Tax=hydrothermal vent metagenome TaxID=652676 RepID=A0A3B0S059_9ZZZZ
MNAANILLTKGSDAFGVPSTASLQEAAQMLDEKKIGAVLVKDEKDRICGVLSERDVARQVARKGGAALQRPVTDCMSRKVITAHPNDTLNDLMNTMTDRRIRHLPVVENGTLMGMISIGDVVKHKINEAEAEAKAMHNYISAQ